ncbi:MAG: hypothetical protein AAGA66_06965 [Bacteroidota bacterium]
MRKVLLFICILPPLLAGSQDLTESTPISITKNWSQEPDGYTYPIRIKVPTEAVPSEGFPVCILLHGNG